MLKRLFREDSEGSILELFERVGWRWKGDEEKTVFRR
jgi:hypothetical protein